MGFPHAIPLDRTNSDYLMNRRIFEIKYAGHTIRYAFQYPATRWRFRNYLQPSNAEEYDILATPERIEAIRTAMPEGSANAYVEYRSLIDLTSLVLLQYNCCILHAVSFLWRGYAWLLTAPSGTGKTTQYNNWQRLFPGEITMICGDMPVLEGRKDGSIWVYPTSWNGKEDLGTRGLSAQVAGVVLLEQGGSNHIAPLPPRDAIFPFFSQFLVRPTTEDEILALGGLMDQLLRSVPVWKLRNLGDDASTELLRRTLAQRQTGGSDNAL